MEKDTMLWSIFSEANIGIIIVNAKGEIEKANPFSEHWARGVLLRLNFLKLEVGD